jgi:hypothetical protein
MNNELDFLGVKFTTRGWSISSMTSSNVGYLSRILSQAVAFVPSSDDSVAGKTFSDLVAADLILVKNVEINEEDLMVELQDVPRNHGISILLKGQANKRHLFTLGTVVKVRGVSGGYVLLLGGRTTPYTGGIIRRTPLSS